MCAQQTPRAAVAAHLRRCLQHDLQQDTQRKSARTSTTTVPSSASATKAPVEDTAVPATRTGGARAAAGAVAPARPTTSACITGWGSQRPMPVNGRTYRQTSQHVRQRSDPSAKLLGDCTHHGRPSAVPIISKGSCAAPLLRQRRNIRRLAAQQRDRETETVRQSNNE